MFKKIVSTFLMATFCSMPAFGVVDDVIIQKSVDNKDYNATTSKSAVNQKALEEAQKEYAAKESELDVDIVPLFQDWTKREAQRKVNNIGNKILISNNLDNFARFEVSRKEAVNATASFNGVVTVYKGLLEYVETDDELAYVLGHELGHVANDDTKKAMIRKGALVAAVVGTTILVGATANNKKGGKTTATALGTAGGATAIDLIYARRAETNADKRGIDFMVRAGYNPLAAISMMNKIMNRRWSGLYDHSSGSKRMFIAYQYIAQKYPKYLVAGYDSISYERAMVHINQQLDKERQKSASKSKKQTERTKSKHIKKVKNNKHTQKIETVEQSKEFIREDI